MLLDYLFPFLIGFVLSVMLTPLVRDRAIAHGWVDRPDSERHLHTRPIPRLGGVAVCASFLIVVATNLVLVRLAGRPLTLPARSLLGILGPAVLICLLGLCDDLHPLRPLWKFSVQAVSAILLYLAGFGIRQVDLFFSGHNLRTAVGLPLTILWVVLITNAFNLIDGLDGLTAGSALFSTIVLLVLSLGNGSSWVAFLAVVLAGSIAGFLKFNFHPATIFLGDCGSLFVGFMLSALALAASQKGTTMIAVAIPVVSFGLPIMDVAIAVVRRYLSGKPLFRADHEHIHHKLLKRGLSQRDAVFILYGVSAALALLSLAMLHGGRIIALVLVVLGTGIFVGVQQLRYPEFFEMGRMLERTVSQKQIIANNVNIRRATESLRTCADASSLCRILTETLRPLGFDGFEFNLPGAARLPESLPIPFVRDPSGTLGCCWAEPSPREATWELNLELISSTGHQCGFFSIYRRMPAKPLLMDVNLLSDGFPAALAGAVHRAVIETYGGARDQKRVAHNERARAMSVS
jgi:UDP-GlcNAc:undecaprenyl-phosphate/decaprenyl-phosphate GlcNAc-1-phosphate transferase